MKIAFHFQVELMHLNFFLPVPQFHTKAFTSRDITDFAKMKAMSEEQRVEWLQNWRSKVVSLALVSANDGGEVYHRSLTLSAFAHLLPMSMLSLFASHFFLCSLSDTRSLFCHSFFPLLLLASFPPPHHLLFLSPSSFLSSFLCAKT